MTTSAEISFLVDTMIVETLASSDRLVKTAQAGGALSSIVNGVKTYIGNQIDPNNKVGSVLRILAPGALWMGLRAMGLGWVGLLLGLAADIFHFDIGKILKGIWDKLRVLLEGNKQISSPEIDTVVASSVQESAKPVAEEDAAAGLQALKQKKSAAQSLREAQWFKIALTRYKDQLLGSPYQAGILDIFSKRRSGIARILIKVLGWVIKVVLASAGLMVAGDVVNKLVGRPNAIDATYQTGKGVPASKTETSVQTVMPVSRQNVFKINPGYRDEPKNGDRAWLEGVHNDEASIENMLINFAKEVYQGLEGKEDLIRSSPAFQVVKRRVVFHNKLNEGDNIVSIPEYFTSKKQIVDTFIDDVAEKVAEKASPVTA